TLGGGAGLLQRLHRALEQRIRDILVEARLDDEDAGSLEIACTASRGSARLGHDLLLNLQVGRSKSIRCEASERPFNTRKDDSRASRRVRRMPARRRQ